MSLNEAAARLAGAWRLMRFDSAGAGRFQGGPREAARSLAVCLPMAAPALFLVFLLTLQKYAAAGVAIPFPVTATTLTVLTCASLAAWGLFLLALRPLAELVGRPERYAIAVTGYCWAQVAAALLSLVSVALGTGFLRDDPILSLQIDRLTVYFLLAYMWFLLRTLLQVGVLQAVMLTLADFTIHRVLVDLAEVTIAR